MGTVTAISVIKLAVKLGIFVLGCVGIASGFNWMNKKQFKKGGGKHDSELLPEVTIGRHH